jgi:type IV secretory pathway VirJ component
VTQLRPAAFLLAFGLAAGGHLVPSRAAAQVGGTSVAVHQGATGSTPDTLIPVGDLPLSLAPAPAGPLLAVLLTGDGGWAAADKSLAAAFVRRNVAVVGLSSPIYLQRQRTPDEAASALTRILRHFLDGWHRERVIIVGYSRGADMSPFMLSRLPEDLRERVALAALLGPGEWANFIFRPLDLIRDHEVNQRFPVSSEVAKLRGTPVLCIYGAKDRGAICPGPRPRRPRPGRSADRCPSGGGEGRAGAGRRDSCRASEADTITTEWSCDSLPFRCPEC